MVGPNKAVRVKLQVVHVTITMSVPLLVEYQPA